MRDSSFKDQATEDLFRKGKHRDFANIGTVALRKLEQLDGAVRLIDLSKPPNNRLEPLSGTRAGQHSIRINQQFRLCFTWTEQGAINVEIVDYH